MKGKLIYYIIGGGILYFIYDKFVKKKSEAVTTVPDTIIPLPVTKPKKTVTINPPSKVEPYTIPFNVGQTIVPKFPFNTLDILDPTLKKVVAKSKEAKYLQPIGTLNNYIKVEAIYPKGIYKVPTKIIGYTVSKNWLLK
jgi:hypothetical protein